MDTLGIALAVCGAEGRVIHMAARLSALIAQDPDGERVVRRVRAIARRVLAGTDGLLGPEEEPARAHEIVQTRMASYRVCGALATHAVLFGKTDVLVTVTPLSLTATNAQSVMQQWKMSKREAEVAVLIANGMRNDAIAPLLGLSPHTIRRHTERVLANVDVSTRTEVAVRLRD